MNLPLKRYFIAEIGSNWRSESDILRSIILCSKAGAHAIKLQYFSYEDLYGITPENKPAMRELQLAWLPAIKATCDDRRMDLIISVFDDRKVKDVDPFVKYHKLASSELTNWQLHAALAVSKKQIIMSTGCSDVAEIDSLVGYFGSKLEAILYCVAAYPARYIDLRNITYSKDRWPDIKIGLSDHSTDVLGIPLSAVLNYGAVMLEKHVNVVGVEDSADAPFSLSLQEFTTLIRTVQGDRRRCNPIFRQPEEDEFAKFARRKVVCTKQINTGSRVTLHHNCELARVMPVNGRLPSWEGEALAPEHMLHLWSARCTIRPGDVISFAQLERIIE